MKRIILSFIFVGWVIVYAAALEFGVNLSNTTEVKGTDKIVQVSQGNSAHVYIQIPTGDFSAVYISGEARFYGFFPCKPKGRHDYLPLAQSFRISRTEWTGDTVAGGAGIQWAVGRTRFNDYSKKILQGLFDGAWVNFTFPYMQVSVAAGYTGLTYKTDANIRIDEDDAALLSLKNKVLAPHRLFFLASSSFSELIPSHTFGFEVLAQFDLVRRKTATHTQYLLPYIYGRMHRNVSWKLWGAIQFGEDSRFFYSAASGLLLKYVNPDWLHFAISGKLDWAAGDYDGDGPMRAFIPVTDAKHTRVAKTVFRDTLTAGLSASIKPVQGLMTELSYTMLTTPNNKKQPVYTGSELLAVLGYSFYNDFDLSFSSGVFLPNKKDKALDKMRWLTELVFTVKL